MKTTINPQNGLDGYRTHTLERFAEAYAANPQSLRIGSWENKRLREIRREIKRRGKVKMNAKADVPR